MSLSLLNVFDEQVMSRILKEIKIYVTIVIQFWSAYRTFKKNSATLILMPWLPESEYVVFLNKHHCLLFLFL